MDSLIADRSITINSLFENFFEVAEFQREYVWLTEDVSELLDGIWGSYKGEDKRQYFIGSIVLSAIDNNKFYIVDGQQRLTTLFLALCGMKARIEKLKPGGSDDIQLIENKLRSLYLDKKSGTSKEFRIKALGENSQKVIVAAFDSDVITFDTVDDSAQRIKEAFITCNDFYSEHIHDMSEVNGFLEFLLHQVCLLPYVAKDMNHAITVFETLNSTGKGLSPIDLVKNILFRETDQDSWEDLQEKWKVFIDILEGTRESPQRFLKYFILVQYGKSVADKDVFDWIRDNSKITNIKKDVFGFLEQLTTFVDAYNNIILGKSPDGLPNAHISNLKKLASRARQHYPFLIAIKNFPKDRRDNFIIATESILIAYGIQRMYTGDIESTFSSWTMRAVKCESNKEIDAFYRETVDPDVKKVGGTALEKMISMTEFSVTKQKLNYLLCRLDAYLQSIADSGAIHKDITHQYKGYDTEHIMSKKEKDFARFGFEDKEQFEQYKHKIGNITILEKALNRSIQDKPFSDKKTNGYQYSNYLLTKGIAVKLAGKNQIAKALNLVDAFEDWSKEAIEERQNNLRDIAAKAFNWK